VVKWCIIQQLTQDVLFTLVSHHQHDRPSRPRRVHRDK
jgi:hypothetical protein